MELIEQLTALCPSDFERLQYLMKVLSPGHELTAEAMHNAICHGQVYVVRSEATKEIIGCGTLAVFHSPTGTKASIEDVVVEPQQQGKGIGKRLVQHLIEEAKRYAPITLQLTSRPSRQVANYLYQTLGFVQRETNVYKMTIK